MYQTFDISVAKERAGSHFQDWDAATARGEQGRNVRRRRKLMWNAMLASSDPLPETAGGIYVFAANNAASKDRIVYIGKSCPTRPLERRISDYIKDDCAWDQELETLSEDEFIARAAARLQNGYPDTHAVFARKHAKLRDRMARATQIIIVPASTEHAVIAQAERILISSAANLGWSILNKQSRKAAQSPDDQARALALQVVAACAEAGLPMPSADDWRASIG